MEDSVVEAEENGDKRKADNGLHDELPPAKRKTSDEARVRAQKFLNPFSPDQIMQLLLDM